MVTFAGQNFKITVVIESIYKPINVINSFAPKPVKFTLKRFRLANTAVAAAYRVLYELVDAFNGFSIL